MEKNRENCKLTENLRFFANRYKNGGSPINPDFVLEVCDLIDEVLIIADMAYPSNQVSHLEKWAEKVRK